MVRIEHVAAALGRMANWTDYDEAQIRWLWGGNQTKVGVIVERAANALIDGLYPGHTLDISWPSDGGLGQGEAALMTSGQS